MPAINRILLAVAFVRPLIAAFVGSASAAGDPASGQQVFAKCAPCHAKDRSNRTGPGLLGIAGRQSGSSRGFHYSRAMKAANIVWDDKSLDAFIASPQKAVPGTTMPFSGIPDQQQRSDLISYLHTLK
jgi:cytochrome c